MLDKEGNDGSYMCGVKCKMEFMPERTLGRVSFTSNIRKSQRYSS